MSDPVYYDEREEGWFFHIETSIFTYGPFATEAIARHELEQYLGRLEYNVYT